LSYLDTKLYFLTRYDMIWQRYFKGATVAPILSWFLFILLSRKVPSQFRELQSRADKTRTLCTSCGSV